MHDRVREFDWENCAFGPPGNWPISLRSLVHLVLDSTLPMCISWGPELRLIYNDAFLPILGQQGQLSLCARMQDVCGEDWKALEPLVQRTLRGEACSYANFPKEAVRNGNLYRGWFTFSYAPVHGDDGAVAGLICIGAETTWQVLLERRQAFELTVSDRLRGLSDPGEIVALACRLLGEHLDAAHVLYLEIDLARETATVLQDWGRSELSSMAGEVKSVDELDSWAMGQLLAGRIVKVDDAAQHGDVGFTAACALAQGRSMLAVPLTGKEGLCAVLQVSNTVAHSWSPDEMALVQDFAQRMWAALERARAEDQRRKVEHALHGIAARQAFQLELADLLQPLKEPETIIAAASALLARHLGVARVVYAEVDEEKGTFHVIRDWTREGIPSLAGRVSRLDDFGPGMIDALRSGQVVAITDIAQDERTAPHADAYEKAGFRAFLAQPLVKEGRLSIVLNLHQTQPFHWKEMDLQRARDMAERTWSYVETARAQAALRAERDQSRYVFDTMTEGFAMLDAHSRLVQINAEGLRMAQLARQDAIGRRVCDIWPKLPATPLAKLYHDVLASGKGSSVEYMRETPDHQVSWIEVRAFPALNGGMAVFYRDISERKQAEEKLKQADRRKDEFVAMLAHELRNPLAPIASAAELLSLPGLGAADLARASQVIWRQVNHMKSLVEDLLDISRVTGGRLALSRGEVDVNSVVPEAIEQVEPLLKTRRHKLVTHLTPVPATVSADRKRLVQVLANLLNNAAKYTPSGGRIEVSVELRDAQVALKVADNGIGMSPQLVASAFQMFAQAERTPDRAKGGLGIGLALVKGIVELHGGSVSAYSRGPGQGSEFVVLLPQARAH